MIAQRIERLGEADKAVELGGDNFPQRLELGADRGPCEPDHPSDETETEQKNEQ